jgi:hypothetical protein
MGKVLQIIKVVNKDLEKLASYLLKQVWRAKDIFDAENILDPGHAIVSTEHYLFCQLLSNESCFYTFIHHTRANVALLC